MLHSLRVIQGELKKWCVDETTDGLYRLKSFDERCHGLFSHPVDEKRDQAPGYSKKIQDPQDLGTLHSLMLSKEFGDLAEVHRRIFQVMRIA